MISPLWIRMYSIPTWVLEGINSDGYREYIEESHQSLEQTWQGKYISYSRICIYLDIFRDLPDGIELTWEDEEWFWSIEYEQILFRCRRCHEHGHLFWEFPQNKRPGGKKDRDNQDANAFTKTQNKKWQARKNSRPEINKRVQTQNRYEILQDYKASIKEAQQIEHNKASNKETQYSD